MPSYITNNLLCVMEKEINKTRKQAERHSKDDKEINDSDYKRQADFEEEGDEEISGED